jgi:hypothetical protein
MGPCARAGSDRGAGSALVARKSALRFSRERIESAQHADLTSSLLLHLTLTNGRRAPNGHFLVTSALTIPNSTS